MVQKGYRLFRIMLYLFEIKSALIDLALPPNRNAL